MTFSIYYICQAPTQNLQSMIYCNYISVFNYFVQHETTSYKMFCFKVNLRLFKACMFTTTHLKVSLTGKEHLALNKQRRNTGKYLYLNRKSSLSELCNHCFDWWSLLIHITFRHLDIICSQGFSTFTTYSH